MASELKNTPIYADRLAAWYGQRITWALYGSLALCVVLGGIDLKHAFAPPQPPFVLKVNDRGEPVGQVLPIRSVQAIPDSLLKAQLADFIHDAFSVIPDETQEDRIFEKTQSHVTGQAAQTLDAWYNRDSGKHHPKLIWRTTAAGAGASDILKLDSPDTYEIHYSVMTRTFASRSSEDVGAGTSTTTNWRAVVHLIVGRSDDPEAVGWFVNYIDFAEVK